MVGNSADRNVEFLIRGNFFVVDLGELVRRVQNVEKVQLVSAKQGSEVLVAMKKMSKGFARFIKYADDDNDEIRKLLPIRKLPQLLLFDQRINDDTDFRKKVAS